MPSHGCVHISLWSKVIHFPTQYHQMKTFCNITNKQTNKHQHNNHQHNKHKCMKNEMITNKHIKQRNNQFLQKKCISITYWSPNSSSTSSSSSSPSSSPSSSSSCPMRPIISADCSRLNARNFCSISGLLKKLLGVSL